MHLSLRAPAIWYLAALNADSADYHAVGFTLPGVPGVVVGHNRTVQAFIEQQVCAVRRRLPVRERARVGSVEHGFLVIPASVLLFYSGNFYHRRGRKWLGKDF